MGETEMIHSPSQSSDYEQCRRIHRRYGTSYYFATRFFDKSVRKSVHALYAFVRVPDEWVDTIGDKDVARLQKRLDDYENALHMAVAGNQVEHPVLRAFADTVHRHQIPLTLVNDFLNAMRMDLTQTRYETFDDLQRYMWGSASVVGIMMCHILGATQPEALDRAATMGTAMQLTNFLRDIAEDWERGRVYLPQSELHRFQIDESQIARRRMDESFRQMMAFQIERARQFYAEGESGIPLLPCSAQYPTLLGSRLYSRILHVIERNNYDIFSGRARTSTPEKIGIAFHTYRAWRKFG